MRVNASVSEADIGAVRVGQRVTFGVDSYPGRTFDGRVLEIRKAPRMVQSVVTYAVMISASNREGLLLPGMTADVRIVVQERPDVLAVPNAALSFRPTQLARKLNPPLGHGAIWLLAPSGEVAEIVVSLGASSDSMTEVAAPEIGPGMRVAVGYRGRP
jgi:HlyD family secretion protein